MMRELDRWLACSALLQFHEPFRHMTLAEQSKVISLALHDFYLKADPDTVPVWDFTEQWLARKAARS
jgi:hypothetical protein